MGHTIISMDPYITIKSALNEWKSSRSMLAVAIKSYQAACTTLRNVCAISADKKSNYSPIAEVIASIDSELESLVAEEKILGGLRMSMMAARNEWVQMSVLPPELLIRIFRESKSYCVREDKTSYQNFAGVCRYWRDVATRECSLWNHIDIAADVSEELPKMALERAQKGSIHVHIHASRRWPSVYTMDQEVTRIVNILSPHIHRVCTVGILSRASSEMLVIRMLDMWLTRGNPAIARSLWVRRPHATSTIPYPPQAGDVVSATNSENSKLMLQALKELELQRTRFDWDSTAYRGLVNLQLSFKIDDDNLSPLISLNQLATILAASPLLSTLKLGTLRISHPEGSDDPTPVRLSCLRDLSIFYVGSTSLELLLRIIILPENSTELRIGLTPQDPMETGLDRFLTLSGATELYMYKWPRSSDSVLAQLSFLKSMLNLQVLVLDNYKIGESLLVRPNIDDELLPTLSALPLIILLDCCVSLPGLKIISGELRVKELRVEKCKAYQSDESLQAMVNCLGEAYPGVKYVITNTDSRENWGYCSADV